VISNCSPRRRNAIGPERRQTSRSITKAAHAGGASRLLTTNTARRQSSSNAWMVFAMATSEPSRSLPTQPVASHLIPSPSVSSFGVRASASAASHSRNAKTSLPDLIMESRPFAPRSATAPVSCNQHIRLGRSNHQNNGAAHHQRPDEAQGRPQETEHNESARTQEKRTGPEGRNAPKRCWKTRPPAGNAHHPFEALPHEPPAPAVEAEWHAHQSENSNRHDPRGYDGHCKQICDHPIGGNAVEVISDVGDCGSAGEQRDDDQADDLAAAPERDLGGERRVAAFSSRVDPAGNRRRARVSLQTTSGSSDGRWLRVQAGARRRPRPSACET